MAYNEGDKVQWNWGKGTGEGKVVTVYTKKVSRKIKDNDVTREADKENPAYYIEQEDGDHVLKSHSELKKK